MPTSRVTISGDVAGAPVTSVISRTASGAIRHSPSIAVVAANTGTLTTRTDGDTGTLTLLTGHTMMQGDVVDLYWDGGSLIGTTIGVVSTNSVPFDGGTGTLPVATTAITAAERTTLDTDFDGDLLEMLSFQCASPATIIVYDDEAALTVQLTATNSSYIWANDSGITNPIAGDTIDYIEVSHGSTAAATVNIGVLYNSDE